MSIGRDIARRTATVSIIVATVTLAGCERKPMAPVAWKSGTTVIPGTFAWDAESNSVGESPQADLRWQPAGPALQDLGPINGTEAAVVKHRSYEQIDGQFLQRWHMPKERISSDADGSLRKGAIVITLMTGEGPDGLFGPGTVVAFRTAEGTLGKLRIIGFRPRYDLPFPGAEIQDILDEGWRYQAPSGRNVERYHLEIEWTLFRP